MERGYHILYAGESNLDHELKVVKRPNISAATARVKVKEIPGREADLTDESDSYDDVPIPVPFNYLASPDRWGEVYRGAILWLRKKGVLQFSDDLSVFRKVRYVTIGENTRDLKKLGTFTATFMCLPGEYFVSGQEFITVADGHMYNAYSKAKPVYEISGDGTCDLTINGVVIQAKVDGLLTIDADRRKAYSETGERKNTSLSGDYDDMALLPGANSIAVSKGFTLRVQPNWRVI